MEQKKNTADFVTRKHSPKKIKAIKIYTKDGKDLVDILEFDGVLRTGLDYDIYSIRVINHIISEDTLIYDYREEATQVEFDDLALKLAEDNTKLYSQFEELCEKTGIEFDSIKKVLDNNLENKNIKKVNTDDREQEFERLMNMIFKSPVRPFRFL